MQDVTAFMSTRTTFPMKTTARNYRIWSTAEIRLLIDNTAAQG